MKIGEMEAGAPDAARLRSTTGLSVAEMRDQLGGCSAGMVGAALEACLKDPIHRVELARMVKAGVIDRRDVLALYQEKPRRAKSKD